MPPIHEEWSDDELVARAAKGDAAAFGDLYERYLDDIYRYAFYRVGDHAEAEDVTENVFLKAWQALPKNRGRISSFRAWIYRIAHNLIIDGYRTRKATTSIDEFVSLRDDAPAPEALAQLNDESATLVRKLSQLKPQLRDVLLCRFVSGLSHAETAQALGLREGHVRVLQHRALNEIRQLLSEDAGQA